MITALNLARIAKVIALLGFVFPWVLVSCSGEPLERLTGIDLATGASTLQHPGGGDPNLWVLLSLAAVLGGIAASFLVAGRRAILAMFAAAIVALIASAVGMANESSDFPAEPRQPQQTSPGGQPTEPSTSVLGEAHLQYGYFITVAGLAAAIGACGVALAGRRRGSNTAAGPP